MHHDAGYAMRVSGFYPPIHFTRRMIVPAVGLVQ